MIKGTQHMVKTMQQPMKLVLVCVSVLFFSCTTPDQTDRSQPQPTQVPQHQPSQSRTVPTVKPVDVPVDFTRGITSLDYMEWLKLYPYRKQRVAQYERFLRQQAGYVPPMDQMLRSARSWQKCGFEPYEIPPEHYWMEMVGTLKLVKRLKNEGFLPEPFTIVSVYRNPELNRCAKGSKGSKHLMNAAVDIRVDYLNEAARADTEYALCEFWNTQGEFYGFGLGLYRSGTIHIDTQGYRRWGSSYGSSSSPCHD